MNSKLLIFRMTVLAIGLAAQIAAAEPSSTEFDLFEKSVRPLLVEHCQKCHGPDKQEAGLRLDTRDAAMRGGDSGPAIVPGKPDQSLVVQAVEYLDEPKMPPDGKLSAAKIDLLRQWVQQGAPWPAKLEPDPTTVAAKSNSFTERQRTWWAFQPVRNLGPPAVKKVEWLENEIDCFILAELESRHLSPAPRADRAIWLRRVTFDLTGLPPTPDEVDSFLADSSDFAYERVVDRLLASPAYGQRWARHWLDVARYADYYDANPMTRTASCEITEAWRYRDWVVDGFNGDLPFNQFIVHQIAGDQLKSPLGEEVYPAGLIATTFLSNGVWDRGDADKEKIVSDMVDDHIDVVGKAFLGLTLGCARCHDHKFDPISTEDYYALAGIFYSSHILKDLGVKGGEYTMNRVPLVGPTELARRAKIEQQLADVNASLAELERQRRLDELLMGGLPLMPLGFKSAVGAIGTIFEDATIALDGKLARDTYTIEVRAPNGVNVRWLRLEVLPDATLPGRGPGRADDGNFVVSKILATYVASGPETKEVPIPFASARADFEQTGFPVASVLDDDLNGGWAISPLTGHKHVAVFELAPDLQIPAGALIRFTISHQHSDSHALGRFRLSAASELAQLPPQDSPERQDLLAQQSHLQQDLQPPVPVAMSVTEGGTPGGLFPGIQDVPIHLRGSYSKLGTMVPRRMPRFFAGDDQRRIESGSGRRELAAWVASAGNPLTARVAVNRVWHWHFGQGLVRTPSNFGLLSEPPSHPALLDWLATCLVADGWSLKSLHRRILLSATYRQSCEAREDKLEQDPENRWLSRFSPRRLEAESIRDAMMSVAGQLDRAFGGPAGDDFTIRRRSLYVQTARWARDSYANLFDAANPDASTERRETSTVAPQALLLLNHPFTRELARQLADRLRIEVPEDDAARVQYAYRLLFGREAQPDEIDLSRRIIQANQNALDGWVDLAHVLLCSNEFIYVD